MKVINETVLLNNIKRLQKTNPLMLVVKDDAYGFGMNRLVLLGEKLNITSYGVRNLEEAVRLRSLAKKADILIFGKVKQDPFLLRSCDLIMTVNDYDDYLFAKKYKIRAHLAIDVGMNRFGMKTGYLALINDPLIEAIYTHLYQEEKKEEKIAFMEDLARRYRKKLHIGGSMAYGKTEAMLRVGRLLYENALAFYGELVGIKMLFKGETVGYDASYQAEEQQYIGICNIGYADGLFLYFNGRVKIEGEDYKVVGKCCMDQCFILLKHQLPLGTSVEFFGEEISEDEFCRANHMTKYELFLQIK